MGLFDLLNPFFGGVDGWFATFMPPIVRLVVWGLLGAIVSMGLYWLLSPQKTIVNLKRRIKQSQQALDAHEGELRDALPLMRQSLALALKQVAVILVPAVVASLPLLFLLAWLYSAYGYRFPAPYTATPIGVAPARLQAHWAGAAARPEIVVDDAAGGRLADIVLRVPLPVVGRRRWWNLFFGDPNGYLPARGPVERIAVGVPAKNYLAFGPGWLRGWETVFFSVLVVVSLLVKFVFRIR